MSAATPILSANSPEFFSRYSSVILPEGAAPAGTETPASPERAEQFINRQNLPIDPKAGHVYQDTNGALLAYGNDFTARMDAAQKYVLANREAVLWVQAPEPYVGADGAARPFVQEVRYNPGLLGVGGRVVVDTPQGEPAAERTGLVNPDTFIRQLD